MFLALDWVSPGGLSAFCPKPRRTAMPFPLDDHECQDGHNSCRHRHRATAKQFRGLGTGAKSTMEGHEGAQVSQGRSNPLKP